MKVVIVDDDEVTLRGIEIKLTMDGYEVQGAPDVATAIDLLDSFKPDLIITDILMQFTSGFEFIGIVRNRPTPQHIPIIVISSLGNEKMIIEAFQLGADDFITKPFNPNELGIRVAKLLRKK